MLLLAEFSGHLIMFKKKVLKLALWTCNQHHHPSALSLMSIADSGGAVSKFSFVADKIQLHKRPSSSFPCMWHNRICTCTSNGTATAFRSTLLHIYWRPGLVGSDKKRNAKTKKWNCIKCKHSSFWSCVRLGGWWWYTVRIFVEFWTCWIRWDGICTCTSTIIVVFGGMEVVDGNKTAILTPQVPPSS